MEHLEFKILLLRKNVTQAQIARALGITEGGVHCIISGDRPGYRFRTKIARMLKMKVSDLFDNGKAKQRRAKKTNRKTAGFQANKKARVPQEDRA